MSKAIWCLIGAVLAMGSSTACGPRDPFRIVINSENKLDIVDELRARGELSDDELRMLETRLTNPPVPPWKLADTMEEIDAGTVTVEDAIRQQAWYERDDNWHREAQAAVSVELASLGVSNRAAPSNVKLVYTNTSRRTVTGFTGFLCLTDIDADEGPHKSYLLPLDEPAELSQSSKAFARLLKVDTDTVQTFEPLEPGASITVTRTYGDIGDHPPVWTLQRGSYAPKDLKDAGVKVLWYAKTIQFQ